MNKTLSSITIAAIMLLSACTSNASAPQENSTPAASNAASPDSATGTRTEGGDADAPAVTVPAPKPAVGKVEVQPGQSTDGFVGAASDVTTETCELDGSKWKVAGTVKNTSDADASYRIYVALNKKDSTDTLALIQVDSTVEKGKSDKWSTDADVSEKDLICVLRVERTAKK